MVIALAPTLARADGIFVAPKFVWDKHKDINEPSQKAIIVYDAGHEDMVLQVKYEGPMDKFGWLIPVPNLPTVQDGSMECFYELSQLTQRRLLEAQPSFRGIYGSLGADPVAAQVKPPVTVIETKTIGAYEIAVLSTKDAGALEKWLSDNQFYLPPDKSDVIDDYIKQQFYFVAVKINLGQWFPDLLSTAGQLAAGDLNPLQISFASSRCIFPLKISSINNTPSEVQLYVLSPEPLLEQALYQKALPVIYSNDLARAENRYQNMQKAQAQMEARMKALRERRGLRGPTPSLPMFANDPEREQMMQKMRTTPELDPDEKLQFTKAATGDLPQCAKAIPRLAGRSWWIAKDTWTFQPADMHDLDFGPALPDLAEGLSTKYGYIAVAGLNAIGADAIPVLIAALQSPNHLTRVNAASILDERVYTSDPRIQNDAHSWLANSEPAVRKKAIYVLSENPDRKPGYIDTFLPLLTDEDADVRDAAVYAISNDRDDLPKYAPVFEKMLTDTNPAVRVTGLRLAPTGSATMDRSEWLSFLKIPDKRAIGIAAMHFRGMDRQYDLSDDEAVVLLQNSEPLARLIGLTVLTQHADARAIELARPLLNDTNASVRSLAERDLQRMTGEDSGQ